MNTIRTLIAALTALILASSTLADEKSDAARIANQAVQQRFGPDQGTPQRAAGELSAPPKAPVTQLRTQETLDPNTASPSVEQTSTQPVNREQRLLGPMPKVERGARTAKSGGIFDHWLVRTAGALAVVIGLMLLCKKFVVRLSGAAGGVASQFGAGGRAPSGVLEILGRFPVMRGQTLVLLKMDRRVLLLGHSSHGFSTLAEITDPDEVASLLVKTRDEEGESMTARFNALLRGMERDPTVVSQEAEPARMGPSSPRAALRAARGEAPVVNSRGVGLSGSAEELAKRLEQVRSRGIRA